MIKIQVQVKPFSKKEGVERIDDANYIVRVNEKPIEGRATERVRELLAVFFECPKSSVVLISGEKSKKKVFSINHLKKKC